ncbi:MAG: hypothetical protein ACTSYA_02325 [Candidatus Kariarchaeaceae archaeon]
MDENGEFQSIKKAQRDVLDKLYKKIDAMPYHTDDVVGGEAYIKKSDVLTLIRK